MPATPTYPGVYVQQTPGGHNISGVATSVAAFIGYAAQGPLDEAVSIASFAEYEQHFGGLAAASEMSYAVYQFFMNGGQQAWVVRVSEGANAALSAGLLLGERTARTGMHALESVAPFNLLCLPGVDDGRVLAEAASYCEERRAFLLIDAPRGVLSPSQMAAVVTGGALPLSGNAAVYYPWSIIANPLNNDQPRPCAPSGSVAGLFARTDTTRGVWKSPAGTEARLVGAQDVVYSLNDNESAMLNALGVNGIRKLPAHGIVAWGARTLRGADQAASDIKYIPVQRLALYIQESIARGTQWAVFELNGPSLWAEIISSVHMFMFDLFKQGALAGSKPEQAYFVRCDKSTMTQNDLDHGRVIILIGFAPIKPGEFVILRVQQMTSQS